MGKDVRGGRIQ